MVISAYDRIASLYTTAYSENDDLDSKYFDYFIENLSDKKVLDMGCGNGINTNYLHKKGIEIIGVDASSKMLDEAMKLFPDLLFKQKDILTTGFDTNSFGGIVLSYVINHFNTEGLNLLKCEIDRILKKDGLVFISAHEGIKEEILPDPLDSSIKIYYNFLSLENIDNLFSDYKREYYHQRASYGEDEFLCDKMFIVYRKVN